MNEFKLKISKRNTFFLEEEVIENIKYSDLYFASVESKKAKRQAKKTLEKFASNMRKFHDYCAEIGKVNNIELITELDIENFINYKLCNLSESTVNSHIIDLRTFFKTALRNEMLAKYPLYDIELLKEREKLHRILELHEITKIIESFDVTKFTKYVGMVLFIVQIDLGCRVSDLVNLRVNNFDLKNKIVEYSITKSKNVVTRPIADLTVFVLKEYIKNVHHNKKLGHLFYKFNSSRNKFTNEPMATRTVNALYKSVDQVSGVNAGLVSHMVRRTVITLHLLNGGDLVSIQKLVGHKDIRSTMKYVNYRMEDLEIKHAKFGIISLLKEGENNVSTRGKIEVPVDNSGIFK